jgi:hypothetical protein
MPSLAPGFVCAGGLVKKLAPNPHEPAWQQKGNISEPLHAKIPYFSTNMGKMI